MTHPYKILIADDEPVIADIMGKKISNAGYQVIITYDGLSAWEKIKSEKPDLVILDLTMPGLEGWEVLQNLRKDPPSKQWIPVIIVSAHQDFAHVQSSMTYEADHYLTKPCRSEEIVKAIRMLLNLSSSRNI